MDHRTRLATDKQASRKCWAWLAVWLVVSGCQEHRPPTPVNEEATATPRIRQAVVIRQPNDPAGIALGVTDEKGQPLSARCATCHTSKAVNTDAKLGHALTQFHQGLVAKHGQLSCVSCHNPTTGYASLRVADGKNVRYADVLTLCGQCHGPQFRDYQHGAHGGMTGYWDLTKGGRVRNNCIDCHDPHAPKYPIIQPVRGPNDRFQQGAHP